MTKRVLLIALALFLFIGGAFLVFRVIGSRRSSALLSPSPGIDDLLPESQLTSPPLPTVEPGPVQTVSLACPEQWSGLPDSDRDGLPDTAEDLYGTDKEKTDTDGDGFTDGEEVRVGFDPRRSVGNPRLDTDGDGLSENDECRWKTDPQNPDTDGDGFTDGDEVKNKYDPTIRGDGQGSDALPERRVLQQERTLDELRPKADSENLTERVAAQILGTKSASEAANLTVTPEEVQRTLGTINAPLNTTLPDVPIADISLSSSNTLGDIRTYLAAVERLRPRELDDSAIMTRSMQSAITGDPQLLSGVVLLISQYEQGLRVVPTPATAVPHHRTLIGIARFVNHRFRVVIDTAQQDPVRAQLALQELQDGLPNHVQTLVSLRADLDRLAAGAPVAAP